MSSGGPETPTRACLLVLPWAIHHTGGVNEVAKNLIQRMSADGRWRPLLLITLTPGSEASQAPCPVLIQELFGPFDPPNRVRSLLSFIAHFPARMFRAWRLICVHQVCIINAHYPHLGLLHFCALRALGLFRGPLVWSFHGEDVRRNAAMAAGLERWCWRILLRCAHRLVTPSRGLRADLLAIEPRCEDKAIVILNGVDVELFSSHREDPDRFPAGIAKRPVILSIGNFEERKGHHILMRAFRRVRDTIPEAALVIVGTSFPYLKELQRLRRELGIERDCFLIADVPHDRIPAYLCRSRLFVLATRSEGMPLALLEADAAGLPVVATRASGVDEIVEDRVTGRLVDIDDIDALAGAILELLADTAQAQRLADRLRTYVRDRLTWHIHSDNHLSLFDDLTQPEP